MTMMQLNAIKCCGCDSPMGHTVGETRNLVICRGCLRMANEYFATFGGFLGNPLADILMQANWYGGSTKSNVWVRTADNSHTDIAVRLDAWVYSLEDDPKLSDEDNALNRRSSRLRLKRAKEYDSGKNIE